MTACSDGGTGESSSEPVYNSVRYSSAITQNAKAESTEPKPESTSTEKPAADNICNFAPVSNIRWAARGNSVEENAGFGHFCAVENGFYFVDPNDGFLYFSDENGSTSIVLEDYVRALNFYDGFLYYIKGTKAEFSAMEHFYAGSIWRLDPVSGEEVCLIDASENMSLAVNKYGIFCNPNGGGLARYGFDGKENERISEENQSVCIIGNKLRVKGGGKTVLHDLDTGEETAFPENMLPLACIGERVICLNENDHRTLLIADLSAGETRTLPQGSAFAFAVCNGELYAADNDSLYRVDLDKAAYESVISYPLGSPVYFYALHSDGKRLFAVMRNQSNASRLAGVNTENGELKYREE